MDLDDSKQNQKINRTKKIKKFKVDAVVDTGADAAKKTTKLKEKVKSAEEERKEVKELFEKKHHKKLIFDKWVQCEECNKWRLLKSDDKYNNEISFKNKSFTCFSAKRSCNEPEDQEPEDAYVIHLDDEIKNPQ